MKNIKNNAHFCIQIVRRDAAEHGIKGAKTVQRNQRKEKDHRAVVFFCGEYKNPQFNGSAESNGPAPSTAEKRSQAVSRSIFFRKESRSACENRSRSVKYASIPPKPSMISNKRFNMDGWASNIILNSFA